MPQVVTAMALLGIIISIAMLVFGNILHQSTSLEDKRISMQEALNLQTKNK